MSVAAHGQAARLSEVNSAMGEMDRMTQQNAAMGEESSAATRSLSAEAERISELVVTFRTCDRETRPDHLADPSRFRRQSALEETALPYRAAAA